MTSAPAEQIFDLAVVGGGMVGASLVAALRHHCPELSIALVEAATQPQASPSFDGRATALSFGSRLLLARWGLWSALEEKCTPIERIQVSDRGHFGAARLSAEQEQVPALGYVIENHQLGAVLQQCLQADKALNWLQGHAVTGVRFGADAVEVELADGKPLRARLLILADGGRSPLARKLGIGESVRDYGQHALVTWVEPRRSHEQCAFERFTDEGPMALLPLVDQRMALVWTMDKALAERRSQLSGPAFCAELGERFGDRLGAFVDSGPLQHYPLSLRQASEQVRSRLVVLGNAAHSLHPVAGQGFNLCLRDLDVLVQELRLGLDAGEPLGQLGRLQHYVMRQKSDQQRTALASDLLVRGFAQRSPLLVAARNLGLLGLDHCTPLKHWFARVAMGLEGQ